MERFKPGFIYERRNQHEFGSTSPMLPSDLDPTPDPASTSITLRRSTHPSRPPNWYGFFSPVSLVATLSTISIPSCYKQAMEHECWQHAMQTELQALEENHTWDIVPCPPTVKPIGSKWVFSVKLHSDGSLDRHKARLVALGNKQEYGVDYEETFAPVAKMTTVRTILAIAASQSWQLHQMDVKNTFLHGDLQEAIYMKLPSGMTTSSPHDVCKLKHSLYGLKQAPRAWFEKFCNTFLDFNITQSQYDSSLFFHTSALGIVLLLVYVDDIIITGIDCGLITKLQQLLHATFHMKDLGHLTYFLGLEFHHRANGIFVNQHKYIQDLITLASLEDTSYVDTLMEVNVKYRKDEGDLLNNPTLYWCLVGSLIYLTTTRPDISYIVHQFISSSRHLHLTAVRRIIHYLQASPTNGLFFYTESSLQLVTYSDADWAGCPNTRRFSTGWCLFLGNALISRRCKKQDRVSKSSTEVECRTMSTVCSEIVWLRGLLEEFRFPQTTSTPLHADNTSTIQIVTNPIFH